MKKTASLIMIIVMMASSLTSGVLADGHKKSAKAMFKKWDKNDDGEISRSEFLAIKGRYMKMDKNEDGTITRAEVTKTVQQRVEKIFARLDQNKDGEISLAERNMVKNERFDKIDKNADGALSKRELKKHIKKQHKEN